METSKQEVEHHHHHIAQHEVVTMDTNNLNDTEDEVTFLHDFIAGGIAGSASVIVGHPFDTLKVRMQASHATSDSLVSMSSSFGGITSLYRGMAAPLFSACFVNAIIFASYGASSRLYDQYIGAPGRNESHDPWQKSFACGSFAGLMQTVIVCPMEHIKCRLQLQHGKGASDHVYKGPAHAVKRIVREHGVQGLFRGWWITCVREIPAFGVYFSFYDFCKDRVNSFLARQAGIDESSPEFLMHTHTWVASALAGGSTGALTWGIVYPSDVIKTHIQTAPMETPVSERRMVTVGMHIVKTYGWSHMWRGLGVTLFRAFPVNGIIFPVYEFTLLHIAGFEY